MKIKNFFKIFVLALALVVLPYHLKAHALYQTPQFNFSFGEFGSGDGQVAVASGLATNPANGNIYLADRGNYRVQIFSPTGNYEGEITAPDGINGPFFPVDLVFNDDGSKLYVVDIINQNIRVFNADGTPDSTIGGPGSMPGQMQGYPMGIAISPDNTKIFLHETGADPTYNNRVHVFEPNGDFVASWTTGSVGSEQYINPGGITLSPDGSKVFVADSNNNVVRIFDQSGNPSSPSQIGSPGSGDGELNQVTGIKVSPDGSTLFVGDSVNSRIHIYKLSDLSHQEQFGEPGYGLEGTLSNVGGITFSLDGESLYVSDSGNDRVTVFDLTLTADSNGDNDNSGGGGTGNTDDGSSPGSSDQGGEDTPKAPRTGSALGFGLLFLSVLVLGLLVVQQLENRHLNKEREENEFH